MSNAEGVPQAGGSDLPLDRLDAWLRRHVEGYHGPLLAERFSGGQSNPTYRLDAGSSAYLQWVTDEVGKLDRS